MKVSTQTTGMPASNAFFSGSISCTLSVGAIRIAAGFLAMTASSTGTCRVTFHFGRALVQQVGADRLGRGFGALVHGDVEAVGGEARDQRDGDLVGGAGASRQKRPRRPRRRPRPSIFMTERRSMISSQEFTLCGARGRRRRIGVNAPWRRRLVNCYFSKVFNSPSPASDMIVTRGGPLRRAKARVAKGPPNG